MDFVLEEPVGGTYSPGDLPKYVAQELQKYGWQPYQAAAIVGNLMHESGMDPGAVGDRGASFGLAQWQGPRRRALESYARSLGMDPRDFRAQVAFIQHELETSESETARRLREARNLQEATRVFMSSYERPSKPALGSRLSWASRVLRTLGAPSEAYAAEPDQVVAVKELAFTPPHREAEAEAAIVVEEAAEAPPAPPSDTGVKATTDRGEVVTVSEPVWTTPTAPPAAPADMPVPTIPEASEPTDLVGVGKKALGLVGEALGSIHENFLRRLDEAVNEAVAGTPQPDFDVAASAPEAAFGLGMTPVALKSVTTIPVGAVRDAAVQMLKKYVPGAAHEFEITRLPTGAAGPGAIPEASPMQEGRPVITTPADLAGEALEFYLFTKMIEAAASLSKVFNRTRLLSGLSDTEALRLIGARPKSAADYIRGLAAGKGVHLSDGTAEYLASLVGKERQATAEVLSSWLDTVAAHEGKVTAEDITNLLKTVRGVPQDQVRMAAEAMSSTSKVPKPTPMTSEIPRVSEKLAAKIGETWKKFWGLEYELPEGAAGISIPVPPKHVLQQSAWAYVDRGLSPTQAIEAIARDLGRRPDDIIRYLEMAPSEVATVGSFQAIVKDAIAASDPGTEPFRKLQDLLLMPKGVEPGGKIPLPRPFGFKHGINPVVPKYLAKDINWLQSQFVSPNILAARVFSPTNNPIVDYATSEITYVGNRLLYEGQLADIVKRYGLMDDILASEREVRARLGDLFIRMHDLTRDLLGEIASVASLKRRLRRMDPKTRAAQELKEEIQWRTENIKESAKGLKKEIRPILAERDKIIRELAAKYSNVRIKMAAAGRDWAQKLCSPEEREIVDWVRRYFDQKKGQLQAQGLPTIEKDYVNFVINHGLSEVDKGASTYVDFMWWPKDRHWTPELLIFMSRLPGSEDWFPLFYQSLKAYIPSVERKLAFNQFLTKWVPEINRWSGKGLKNAADWLKWFIDANLGAGKGSGGLAWLDSALHKLINIEYARTLAFNLSPPFLHLFKLLQTPGWHGTLSTARGIKRFGKAVSQMALGAEGPERALLEAYVKVGSLVKAVEQAHGLEKALTPEWWRRVGMSPTTLVEWFDNGVNILTYMDRVSRAMAKGKTVSPFDIHGAIIDTMLRLNFRGYTTPRAFSSTYGRLGTMYMMQPYKLLENKADLLLTILTEPRGRDEFGDLNINKFARLLVLYGGAYALGRYYGFDLTKHVFHLPFVGPAKETGEETLWFFTPPMQLAEQLATKGLSKGLWQHFTAIPSLDRFFVLLGDPRGVPRKYSGPWSYMLGVPKAGWREELKYRLERSKRREELRGISRRKEYYSKTPLQLFLEDLWRRGKRALQGKPAYEEDTEQGEVFVPPYLQSRVTGGPVEAGKPYLVGEAGPEAFFSDEQLAQFAYDQYTKQFGLSPSVQPAGQPAGRSAEQPLATDTLAEYGMAAGEMVGEFLDLPMKPVREALGLFYDHVLDPLFAMRRRVGLTTKQWAEAPEEALRGAPEAFAPLPSKEVFVEGMSFGLSPMVYGATARGLANLAKLSRLGFLRYAPDFVFKPTAKGGLPAIAEELTEAKMARSNPYTRARLIAERILGETAKPSSVVDKGVDVVAAASGLEPAPPVPTKLPPSEVKVPVGPEPPLGFSTNPRDFLDPDYLEPDHESLWHVTSKRSAVLKEGLKSRRHTGVEALGGGFDNQAPDLVSVTFDEGHASVIADRLEMAIRSAKGEVTAQEVLDYMLSSVGISDDTPYWVAKALRAPKSTWEDWEAFEAWIDKEYKDNPYGLLQELDDALYDIYPEWEGYGLRVGLTGSKEMLKRLDPSEIDIVQVAARKGATFEYIPAEAELRFKPEDLFVVTSGLEPAPPAPAVSVEPGPVWYSKMAEHLERSLPARGTAEQFAKLVETWASKGAFKQDELKWSGLVPWLRQRGGSVTKQEVLDWLRENSVQLDEHTTYSGARYRPARGLWRVAYKREPRLELPTEYATEEEALEAIKRLPGGADTFEVRPGQAYTGKDIPKYEAVTIPSPVNYREHLVMYHVPDIPYVSRHWSQPNVMVHIRTQDMTTADGRRVLFIDEVQSDWHQRGKRHGYRLTGAEEWEAQRRLYEIERELREVEESDPELQELYRRLQEVVWQRDRVRSQLRTATTGEHPRLSREYRLLNEEHESLIRAYDERLVHLTQDLIKESTDLRVRLGPGAPPEAPFKNTWHELAMKRMLRRAAEEGYDALAWPTEKLVPVIEGWGISASEIRQDPRLQKQYGAILDRYEKVLPSFMKQYAKQWGSTVEKTHLEIPEASTARPEDLVAYVVNITPEMRQSVIGRGQPMFQPPARPEAELGGAPAVLRTPPSVTRQLEQLRERYNIRFHDSAHPVEEAEVRKLTMDVGSVPDQVHSKLLAGGTRMEVVGGSSIVNHPMFSHLKGQVPRGYEGTGQTFDTVEGVTYYVGGRPLIVMSKSIFGWRPRGTISTTLHELGHASFHLGLRNNPVVLRKWADVHRATLWGSKYFAEYPEEAFAEMFAYYFGGRGWRDLMPQAVRDFFKKLYREAESKR